MENRNTAVATTTQEKNITEDVLNRVKDLRTKGDLQLPVNYSAENALKSAYLILSETNDKNGKPVLQVCSKPSIANALLDMVIQGLSPAKKQCYFVAYGNKLQLMRSYMGTVAVTKRLHGVKNVVANCIYDGDEFDYELDLETGEKKITKHKQNFENIDMNKIKGAYAIVITEECMSNHVEIMNINQIKAAWNQGTAYRSGKSTAHNNFTDEMAKKTVINRACKMFANTSDDSDLLIGSFNNSDKSYEDDSKTINNVEYEVREEINEKANSKAIDIEPQNVVNVEVKEESSEDKNESVSKEEVIEGQVNILEDPGF